MKNLIALLSILLFASFARAQVVPARAVTGVQISPKTTCPIAAGASGWWNNNGVEMWRNADGSDIVPITGTPTTTGDILYSTVGGRAMSPLHPGALNLPLLSGGPATAPSYGQLPNSSLVNSQLTLTLPGIFAGGGVQPLGGTWNISFVSQSQGLFLASPAGGSGALSPRAIVASDLPLMGGATNSTPGTPGIVTGAAAGQQSFFWRADGTWASAASAAGYTTVKDSTGAAAAQESNLKFGSDFTISDVNPDTVIALVSHSITATAGTCLTGGGVTALGQTFTLNLDLTCSPTITGAWKFTTAPAFDQDNITTTQIVGASYQNNTAASAGVTVQNSPMVEMLGHRWQTTTPRDEVVKCGWFLVPLSGASGSKGGNLSLYCSVNGAAYSNTGFSLGSDGSVVANTTSPTVLAASTGISDSGYLRMHRVTVSDVNYTVLSSDHIVALTAMTAPRTFTLAPNLQSSSAAPDLFTFSNETNNAQTLTISMSSGQINNAASVTCSSNANGGCNVYCDGTNCHKTASW